MSDSERLDLILHRLDSIEKRLDGLEKATLETRAYVKALAGHTLNPIEIRTIEDSLHKCAA